MRNLLCFFLFLILLVFDTNAQKDDSKLILEANLKGSYGLCENDNYVYCLFNIRVINKTNSISKFWTFNCTTADNLVFNTSAAEICENNCPSNHLTLISIKPNECFELMTIIKLNGYYNWHLNPLKIGFFLLQGHDMDLKYKKNNKDVIWSEPIIFDLIAQPYEIK